LNLELTHDEALINAVMTSKGIWEKLAEDVADLSSFKPNINNGKAYLVGHDEDGLIGISIFCRKSKCAVEYHPMVLATRRRKARRFINDSVMWLFNNTPYIKINLEIPEQDKATINLARKFGCVDEGIRRFARMRDNEIINTMLLGLEKGEFKHV
jgi:hypothetical protein